LGGCEKIVRKIRVLVVQNCEAKGIGLYEQHLIDRKIKYDFFIAGGTPISACEIHKHNFLEKEWRYLEKVVKLNKAYFGICFGAQILARLLGAKVRKKEVMEVGGYDVTLTSDGVRSLLV